MKRSRPRFRSEKTEAKYVERRVLVARLLGGSPGCQACLVFARHDGKRTFVLRPAVDVHELVRRSRGGSILDEGNCITVCRPCHRSIGASPALAERLGLELPSWATAEMFLEAAEARRSGIKPSWVD